MRSHHRPPNPAGAASGCSPIAAFVLALVSVVALGAPARADAPGPDRQSARYEVRFLTDMIDHHQMAIEMSQM